MNAAKKRKQRGFAGAIRTDDAAQLSRQDIETHVVGGNDTPEPLGQCLRCKYFGHHQRSINAERHPRRGSSRAMVTMMPFGKNNITPSSSAPIMTSAYWLPAEDRA